jgi:hypothetical protein
MTEHLRQIFRAWLIGVVILFPLYGIEEFGNAWASPTGETTMSADTGANSEPPIGKRQGQSPKLKPGEGQGGKSMHKRHGQSPKNKSASKGATTTPSAEGRQGQSPSNE